MENTPYTKFLISLLADLDLHVDVNDTVRYNDEARTPILVDGRRLVLPTERHRRNPSDEILILHPLAENTVADISPVLRELVKLGSVNLNILFATYAAELTQIAGDHGRQVGLTDAQIDLIAKLKSCKPSSEKDVAKVVAQTLMAHQIENSSNSFIQLGLTRGRMYRGENRHRACTVAFPMLERLIIDDSLPKDQKRFKVTADVNATLIELHEALFPACREPEAYGYCDVTNRTVAPFFVTFAMTYAQLASEFKERFKVLRSLSQFTASEEPPTLDWVKDLQDNDQIRRWANEMPDTSSYAAPLQPQKQMQAPALAPAPMAPVETKPADTGVAYMGPKVLNAAGQLVEIPPPSQQVAPEQKSNAREISPDEFLRSYSSGSPFAAVQNTQSMLKAYIEGYAKFWDGHVAQYRVPPTGMGMVHPQQIPRGVLPPVYPNMPPLPPGFYPGGPITATVMPTTMMPGVMPGMPGMQYPQQQYGMPQYGMPQYQQPGYPGVPGYPGMPGMVPGMYPNPAGGAVVYGSAVNTGGYAPQQNLSAHPAFAGTAVGAGTVSPGTV